MNKTLLREKMLNKRMELSQEVHRQLSKHAVNLIKKHPFYKQAKHIGVYHPIKKELDILSLTKDLDKAFYLPKVFGDTMHYLKHDTSLEMSDLGILEPHTETRFDETLDLIIVPALAVDKHNHRVGYGKGFFDKYIKKYDHLKTLGLVIAFQVVESITYSKEDMPLHDIIVIPFRGEE